MCLFSFNPLYNSGSRYYLYSSDSWENRGSENRAGICIKEGCSQNPCSLHPLSLPHQAHLGVWAPSVSFFALSNDKRLTTDHLNLHQNYLGHRQQGHVYGTGDSSCPFSQVKGGTTSRWVSYPGVEVSSLVGRGGELGPSNSTSGLLSANSEFCLLPLLSSPDGKHNCIDKVWAVIVIGQAAWHHLFW